MPLLLIDNEKIVIEILNFYSNIIIEIEDLNIIISNEIIQIFLMKEN